MLVPPSVSSVTPESKSKEKNISGKATVFRAQLDLNSVAREDEDVGG